MTNQRRTAVERRVRQQCQTLAVWQQGATGRVFVRVRQRTKWTIDDRLDRVSNPLLDCLYDDSDWILRVGR